MNRKDEQERKDQESHESRILNIKIKNTAQSDWEIKLTKEY